MSKLRILILDDDETLVSLMAIVLRGAGFEVEPFSSPPLALDFLKQNLEEIDLVISDQTMPEMLGLNFLYEVKKLNSNLPTILVSGHNDVLDNLENESPVTLFLQKPVDIQELVKYLKTFTK
jgi:DNA-binding NtrC family response regulator